jgi:transposase
LLQGGPGKAPFYTKSSASACQDGILFGRVIEFANSIRTFGWLNRSRRLSKDFEVLCETSEAWVRIAMIHIMVRRLAKAT